MRSEECQVGGNCALDPFGFDAGVFLLAAGFAGKIAVASAALHFSTQRSAVPSNRVGVRRMHHAVQPHHQSSRRTANMEREQQRLSESRSGPGLHGRPGFVASWRPIYQCRGAIKVGGSPFKTLAEAEVACTAMLAHLTDDSASGTTPTAGKIDPPG
jgi:hypothetical protein